MASLSFVNDITKPLDTNNWFPRDKNDKAITKDQMEAMKTIEKMEHNLNRQRNSRIHAVDKGDQQERWQSRNK
jgi:hypothetical protein